LKLEGSIEISGAKNAALPLLASTILASNEVQINNIPEVKDVKTLLKLIGMLGGIYTLENNRVTLNTQNLHKTCATYDIVKTMRASVLVLGPILARFGECEVSLPGGCAIGERPIDLHLAALEKMGAKIEIVGGYVKAQCEALCGAHINFDKITVTGTENIVMAAALAKGTTTISNAAKEPEVVQLCQVLKDAGVNIEGIGSDTLIIEGTNKKLLEFKPFGIIPDRIEAGTYLCAGAITNSKITINKVEPKHLDAVITKFEEMGFDFEIGSDTITILPADTIKPVNITTAEYPAFPTDMQAQFMAVAAMAGGVSIIEEKLFENRFMHVSELRRLGANISLNGHSAIVTGTPDELIGADVMATDLRASSALVLAALVSKDKTDIHRIYHLDRGYEFIERKLQHLGVKIERLSE
jgi:UDP-N-acetylglucosamine 1-carboxyvinyltransferase